MAKPLDGKAAIVTGGSGAIGAASAKHLLRDGAAVLLMGRRPDALEKTRATLLKEIPDGQVECHSGDAMIEADVKAAVARANAMRGRLDIAVATVGGGHGFKPLLMLDAETFRAQFERNVVSAFLLVRHTVPLMAARGAIVCISSNAGKMPFAYLAGYHTAKGGLENFVRAAAEELGSAGVRIHAVRPGLTRAERPRYLFEDVMLAKFVAEYPLGRAGEPDDIGAAVRFLAGPESSWMTGQSFAADGGQELRKNPDRADPIIRDFGQAALDAAKRGKPFEETTKKD